MSKPTGKPNGRPKKDFDKDVFEQLCGLQCTINEVSGFFKTSNDTIERWCKDTYNGLTFSKVFDIYRQVGKASLRRIQFQQAQKHWQMAKWLGANWLGQTDRVTIDNNEEKINNAQDITIRVRESAINDNDDGGDDDGNQDR